MTAPTLTLDEIKAAGRLAAKDAPPLTRAQAQVIRSVFGPIFKAADRG
ncbi:hypothetical protein [Gordonia humi]|uniref:Uncharacterized protein n=1 Tax=Gordonia humi TaxID=686429 RepID=A0A840EWN6_9ACTN|nr:hypothetical protein [Gordonia humi]MBB4136082.1 hypothetical protein [Gordonia humi]